MSTHCEPESQTGTTPQIFEEVYGFETFDIDEDSFGVWVYLDGTITYRMPFSLSFQAESEEEAKQRAMQWRYRVENGEPGQDQHTLGWDWHLHDYDGC